MRVIKFRGRTVETGNWVYGSYQADVLLENKHTIIYSDYEGFYCEDEVIPETIGQYTGLKDMNNKEIFEGDILKTEDNVISKIIYDEASFKCVFYHNDHLVNCLLDNLFIRMLKPTIIGNIYNNPELIEG